MFILAFCMEKDLSVLGKALLITLKLARVECYIYAWEICCIACTDVTLYDGSQDLIFGYCWWSYWFPLSLSATWWPRSLKLGIVPGPIMSRGSCQPMVYGIQNAVEVSNFSWNDKKTRQGKESSILSRSCLNPLSGDSGAAGYVWNLETLIKELFVHIYDFFWS